MQSQQTECESFMSALTPAMCITTLKIAHEFGLLSEWSLYRLVSERHRDGPSFDLFKRHLQDMVSDDLLTCIKQSRQDPYHKKTKGLPGTPGQNAYHLTATGEDYLESRGIHLAFGMNAACYVKALACSDALLQLGSLFSAPVILRGPAALVAWETTGGQEVISLDGLLIQPATHGHSEQAYLVMLSNDDQSATIQDVIKRYELLLQPALAWNWDNWYLSKMPTLLFLSRTGDVACYTEELERWHPRIGDYAMLALADLWQGNINIHNLTC
jgi:hypothetical protein